jgi:hypothetical protein
MDSRLSSQLFSPGLFLLGPFSRAPAFSRRVLPLPFLLLALDFFTGFSILRLRKHQKFP